MEDYILFDLEDSIYDKLCFVNTTDDIILFLDSIKTDVSTCKNKKVIIDLILQNGYNFNRYISIDFKGDTPKYQIVNVREVDYKIKELSDRYLSQNLELIEDSALSTRAIAIIKKILGKTYGVKNC